MDGYLFTNNSGNYNIPINTNGVTGGTITIPANTWNPGNGGFTITIGGGGGGGGTLPPPPADTIVEVKKIKNKDGCSCRKCKEFFPYAEPNQEDGTLVCWSCRHGY